MRCTLEFDVVLCVESGDGFKAGSIYPVVGGNNGNHILTYDEYGDEYVLICHGFGLINNSADDSKKTPRFISVELKNFDVVI